MMTEDERQATAAATIKTMLQADNGPELLEALAAELATQHRTHQQSFWRTVQRLAQAYQVRATTDARNEGALAFARAIAKLEIYLAFL